MVNGSGSCLISGSCSILGELSGTRFTRFELGESARAALHSAHLLFRFAVRTGFALRAPALKPTVRTPVAVHAVPFQPPVRARVALVAAVFYLAVRARGALLAAAF